MACKRLSLALAFSAIVTLASAYAQDNWKGGTGNWSNPSDWSAGLPGAASDVVIYSGGNDNVTLDTSPTINSLTLGGASNGYTSELTDGGVAQTLTITNGLTVRQTGFLNLTSGSTASVGADSFNAGVIYLGNTSTLKGTGNFDNAGIVRTGFGSGGGNTVNITGNLTNNSGAVFSLYKGGDVANVATLNNSGYVFIAPGATLNLTNQMGGITDVVAGSEFDIYGTFHAGSNNAFAGLNSVEGTLYLGNGQTTNITPGSSTLTNSGDFEIGGGSTASITGNVTNSRFLFTSYYVAGGNNTLTITGTLTQNQYGDFIVNGSGDVANVATLNNLGYIAVEPGATLNLTSQPNGITDAVGGQFDLLGSFNAGGGNGFANLNSVEGTVNLFGQNFTDTPGSGTLTISADGSLTANYNFASGLGTTLTIMGNVNNSGFFGTGYNPGGNTLNITGDLTNTSILFMLGAGDMVYVNGNFDNSGLIEFANSTTLTVGGNMTNEQTGGVYMYSGDSTLQVRGDLDNAGTLYTSYYGYGGNTVTVGGNLTNEATGQITLNGPGDLLQVNGMGGLTNNGLINVNNGSSIDPPVLKNGGTINIDSLSKMIVGTGMPIGLGYIQLANGTLGEIITPNGYGVINVQGSALLAGTLNILLQGGLNPSVGSTYKFLLFNSGQLTGMFANIKDDIFNNGTEKWMVDYDSAGGYVELIAENNGAPVPEPATLLVLIPGLLGMGYGLRRKLCRP